MSRPQQTQQVNFVDFAELIRQQQNGENVKTLK